jgi:putative DNA primase/helicase
MEKSVLDKLLDYTSRGWPIFPLHWTMGEGCSCGNCPCRNQGKHPILPRGFKLATTDPNQVEAWHKTYPDANWGMRTGDRATGGAGILVVDLDPKNHGFDTWDMLSLNHPDREETIKVITGNLGQHRWYKFPEGLNLRSSAGTLGPGVDIRANNGYVVIPPSRTTNPYYFEFDPEETPLARLPEWLLAALEQAHSIPQTYPRDSDLVPQGERHQTLLILAGNMRRVGMDFDVIVDVLRIHRNQHFSEGDHPVTDQEIENVARWVCQKPKIFHRTDLGNAERFREQNQNEVRYCFAWKKWLRWNQRYWVIDDLAGVMLLAHDTVRSILVEAANQEDEKMKAELIVHGLRSESTSRIDNLIRAAAPYLEVRPSDLDQHPDYLNVRNGIIDLRTGDLLPHDPSLMLTRFIDVDYQPEATCPQWRKFLKLVTGNDQELIDFLKTAVGYTLTGHTSEHALFFLYGIGSNGKTTFTETIRKLMRDYAKRVSIDSLLDTFIPGGNANPYIADMAGARMVLASEIPENRKLNESLVKELTGGDAISARYLFSNPFTFEPSHKLWLFGNYKPRITGSDEGIWRRIRIIPFSVTIPRELRRPMHQVLASFEAELPGILVWAVEGSRWWYANSLESGSAVRNATSEYRSDQDIVKQFLDERCLIGVEFTVQKDDLYQAWHTWCETSGETDASRRSKKWLTHKMTGQGFSHHGDGKTSLKGLKLAG